MWYLWQLEVLSCRIPLGGSSVSLFIFQAVGIA